MARWATGAVAAVIVAAVVVGGWQLFGSAGDDAAEVSAIEFVPVTAPVMITAPPRASSLGDQPDASNTPPESQASTPSTQPAATAAATSATTAASTSATATSLAAGDPSSSTTIVEAEAIVTTVAPTAVDPADATTVPPADVNSVPPGSTLVPVLPTSAVGNSGAPQTPSNSVGVAPPGSVTPLHATIEGGELIVRGAVRDLPTAQRVLDDIRFRRGGEAVNELVVDPAAPEPLSLPVFVPGAALFGAEDGARLTVDSEAVLQLVARVVINSPGQRLLIRGHTDDVGSDAYNFALSQQRIAAVFEYLRRQGVDAATMQLEPKGETEPIADNASAEGRARNRRVELIVVAV